ncbi:MAG: DUF885 domain-containing protein [Acidobacteriota bacterium]|nr:DUF885 domain-containing protein [Acidobacteriota bacterium]
MRCRAVVAAVVVVAGACAAPSAEPPGRAEIEGELERLFDDVWQRSLEQSVLLRVREGLAVVALDDLTHAGFLADLERSMEWLERLEAIDLSAVDRKQALGAEALRWRLETALEGERWFWHEGFLTPYLSPLPDLRQVFSSRPVATRAERLDYLPLLAQVPGYLAQIEDRARGQAERGIAVWKDNLAPCVALVRALSAPLDEGPFGVATERFGDIAASQLAEFQASVGAVVSGEIAAAVESLAVYLEGPYAEVAPDGVGAAQWPDGEEYYRFATRRSTTMDVTPAEVHEIGNELVAEMEADMASIRSEVDPEVSRDAFRADLRTNERFFPTAPEEVGERLMVAAADMDAVVDRLFASRPDAPYAARRLDPTLEASQTYGYYDPPRSDQPEGIYFFNGSRLDERSWLNLRAVSLHELIPGHHFHIGRQLADPDLPQFRRGDWHGAFTEGWGSYATWLGVEAGIYDEDPYSRYGMYILEIFLATRLVVDTGMNVFGWTLEEGREYMREHTLESETQIATESLRYAADMPAQALAYQMGKLKFIELRERAAQSLGERFDVRRFHEAILENGSLPMSVLERHIDRWIEEERERSG